ncbi:Hypothetical protein, conserved [Brucella ceti str. Cudo]|uniref:Uncharacterized protein n=2 Tax=Brucella TaxID=234 RepID=A0A0H3AMX3_BRUO2|nr:hypothetical protein BOV_1128 [Brucella ovis ATCC 25840]EEH14689.1 Hypothetical protein, conserved [Brucella ceti str. Cudo]
MLVDEIRKLACASPALPLSGARVCFHICDIIVPSAALATSPGCK